MASKGCIYRIAFGIYVLSVQDAYIGNIFPDIDKVAKAIAKRDKARIAVTQVPMNIVYYTDASPRKIKIGNQNISFKKTTAKNLSMTGKISSIAIQALRSIGKNQLTTDELAKIKLLLKSEKRQFLKHDLQLAPAWIRTILF